MKYISNRQLYLRAIARTFIEAYFLLFNKKVFEPFCLLGLFAL